MLFHGQFFSDSHLNTDDGWKFRWRASRLEFDRPARDIRAMTDAITCNRAHWDEVTPIHFASPFYEIDAFRRGERGLDRLALEAVGDVSGQRLLHLQCHIGRDTLSLARLGAEVVGLDFSEPALETARALALDIGVPATFVQSDVLAAPSSLTDFDIVFASWGAICWIGDMGKWMRVAAQALRPGGRLVLLEGHPTMLIMDDKLGSNGPYVARFPYDSPEPQFYEGEGDYADREAVVKNHRTVQWAHGIGRILTAAMDAGLSIRSFIELDRVPWEYMPQLVPVENGYWGLPPEAPSFPLAFSLVAVKS